MIARDLDRARADALRADASAAAGDDRPLLGLSMTVKDNFDLEGPPTTRGEPSLRRNVASAEVDVSR